MAFSISAEEMLVDKAELLTLTERVHGLFAESCPVYRSLKGSIAMTTDLDFQAE